VTRNGEVTLTGIAKNDAEKALVTKLVTDIRGVTGVKNQMTVQEKISRARPASATPEALKKATR
jgi:hypothetical protein